MGWRLGGECGAPLGVRVQDVCLGGSCKHKRDATVFRQNAVVTKGRCEGGRTNTHTFDRQNEGELEFGLVVVVQLRERCHLRRSKAVEAGARLLALWRVGARKEPSGGCRAAAAGRSTLESSVMSP
jgi:hypothetical protein